ncbi:MAG: hypothetical protein NC938_03475, partial [Candidatus Omnitrophica bacterium]|nr:hypothetical protein [Candidatus Omnitrophota bacterium]
RGSGGSVWIDAGTLSGNGIIRANGGGPTTGYSCVYGGGGGRISFKGTTTYSFTGLVQVIGGWASIDRGRAGTIYFNDQVRNGTFQLWNTLYLGNDISYDFNILTLKAEPFIDSNNNRQWDTGESFTDLNGNGTFDAGKLYIDGDVYDNLNPQTGLYEGSGGILNISGSLTVELGAMISADGFGFTTTQGPGGSTYGGTYGGKGGGNSEDATYGSFDEPVSLGSGGQQDYGYGPAYGGGAIKIVAAVVTVNGIISADGTHTILGRRGSGGSVWIDAGTLSGNGIIRANGGGPTTGYSCVYGGGGGRISIVGNDLIPSSLTMTAYGGSGTIASGAAGTIFTQTASQYPTGGELIINNNVATAAGTVTELRSAGLGDISNVIVRLQNKGKLTIIDDVTIGSISIETSSADAALNITNRTIKLTGDWSRTAGPTVTTTGSTVEFIGTGSSEIRGSTMFNNLACQTKNKTLIFESGSTQTINGTLTLGDPSWSEGDEILLRSTSSGDTPADRFKIANPNNVQTVFFVDVRNSEVISGNNIFARYSINSGNTDCREGDPRWIFGVDVSGIIYLSPGVFLADGYVMNIYVHDGTENTWIDSILTSDEGSYNFKFEGVPVEADHRILIYLNSGLYEANLVTLASDSVTDITGLEMYVGRIALRSESTTAMTNAYLADVAIADANVHFKVRSGTATFADNQTVWTPAGFTYLPAGQVDIEGSLLNEGTLIAGDNTITITGDWDNKGTFDKGASKVIFTGTGLSRISGQTTFNDLECVAAGKELRFGSGERQTVAGTLTLTGDDINNLLILRSSTDGVQWEIEASSVVVSYIDVKDSKNASGMTIINDNSRDSGNNTGWYLVHHFTVEGASEMEAGKTNELTVRAFDGTGGLALSFTGTQQMRFYGPGIAPDGVSIPTVEGVNVGGWVNINFTEGVSDPALGAATLIAYRAETVSVDVEDSRRNSFGDEAYDLDLLVKPTDLNYFTIEDIPDPIVAGVAASPKVSAFDIYQNLKYDYQGIVTFSATDTSATLPSDYQFSLSDAGIHVFANSLILRKAGEHTVRVEDTVGHQFGEDTAITVECAGLHHFGWVAIENQVAGTPFTIVISAYDIFGNITIKDVDASYFTDREIFTYTTSATVSPNGTRPTLGADDDLRDGALALVDLRTGVFETSHITFFNSSETPVLTVEHDGVIKTTDPILVLPARLASFTISGITSGQVVGTSLSCTVTAFDPYANLKTNYADQVAFSSNGSGSLPASAALNNGTGQFGGIVFSVAGVYSLTVADPATGISATHSGIVVIDPYIPPIVINPPQPPTPDVVKPMTIGPQISFSVDFVDREEVGKRYKNYPRGKYQTTVIVFEGKVAVSPYDEKGIIEDKTVLLTDGKKAVHTGEVR